MSEQMTEKDERAGWRADAERWALRQSERQGPRRIIALLDALDAAEQRADRIVSGVRAWCAINEIAEPPVDWEGLGEFLARVESSLSPGEPSGDDRG